ncbi:hypothetical protein UP17_08585 [Peribacillus simplex]|uniref:hypothetical protein n=1 Tax=Peribacillus simplex TaxID=1478 RepID=UPI000777ACCD|nr:hypothetical protein [Peribacillus simplex]AMM92591.1 hypothetical protein UP17_08585 [Peribacillus simplex]
MSSHQETIKEPKGTKNFSWKLRKHKREKATKKDGKGPFPSFFHIYFTIFFEVHKKIAIKTNPITNGVKVTMVKI